MTHLIDSNNRLGCEHPYTAMVSHRVSRKWFGLRLSDESYHYHSDPGQNDVEYRQWFVPFAHAYRFDQW